MSEHPIVHIEFSAQDPEITGKFYSDLFGWNVKQMPEMNYASFEAEGGPGGGFNPVDDNNPAGSTLVYVQTDDLGKTLSKVEALGGRIEVPETEIPNIGWFAIFSDLSGNRVGLFKNMEIEQ